MDDNRARVNALVTGRVQGVFYRASTMEQAQGLSLTGWVQNLADGSVEIMAEGPRYALEQLMEWCKVGPADAEVHHVSVRWEKNQGEFKTFRIR